MNNLQERIRRLLTGNVNSSFMVGVYVIFGIIVLLLPAYVLERFYFNSEEPYICVPFCTLLTGLSELTKKYTIYGIIRIALWIWSAVVVATSGWPIWVLIGFYILMVVGVMRLATVWWSGDNKLFGNREIDEHT